MKGIQDTSNITYRQLVGNGLRYEIPKFQRDYTWEIEQWEDLWNDILNLQSDEEFDHYMGYLVLQTKDSKNFQVIDGQQRLTTLSILILAVLKCIKTIGDSGIDAGDNEKRLELLRSSYIGYLDPATLVSNNKLKLNRNCDAYYSNYLVTLKELPTRNINTSEKQMRACFNWYFDKLKNVFKTGKELAKFVDSLVDRLFFTRITVSDDFNAFKVFETLNAQGVQLSAADLLKNYLFSKIDETKPHISEIETVESLWANIIQKLRDKKFEEYLRYFWNSKHKTVRKTELFKTFRKEITTKTEVFTLIRDLDKTADIYMALQDPNDELWIEKPEISDALNELKLFKIKQPLSLLIAAYENLDETLFITLIQKCVIISFRYNIICGLNPNEQEEVYNAVARKIIETKQFIEEDFKSIYVENEKFETSFKSKEFTDNKQVKYILGKIEKYKYHHDIPFENSLFTVEHILPQNADEKWGKFSNESIKRNIYNLGNLTLLEKKLNREADVSPYSVKKLLYQRSDCKATQEIAEKYEKWTENTILERQKEFAKDAKSIWQLQFHSM